MKRKLIWMVGVLAATSVVSSGSAYSALTHVNNPYRSFNSGVNYGAQRWQQRIRQTAAKMAE